VVTLVGLWYVQRLHLSWRELIGTAEKGTPGDDSPPGASRDDAPPAAPEREARRA